MPVDPRNIHAFTLTGQGGWLREIITKAGLAPAFDPPPFPKSRYPQITATKALWDTGATGSVVTKAVAKSADLQPVGLTLVRHAGGSGKPYKLCHKPIVEGRQPQAT